MKQNNGFNLLEYRSQSGHEPPPHIHIDQDELLYILEGELVHADWIMAFAFVPQPQGAPQMLLLLFPAAEAEVFDTWQANGMAGTGSNEVRVEGLFVPERRVLRDMNVFAGKGAAAQAYPEAVYRAPILSYSGVVSSAVALGAARRALAIFREQLGKRQQKGADVKQSDKPAAQIRLAEADVMISTAELLIRQAAREAGTLGELEMAEQVPLRISFRARVAYAVSLCRKAAFHLAEGAGSSVHMLGHPFQRVIRDLNILSSHVGFDPDLTYELHGRSLLGLPPNSIMF